MKRWNADPPPSVSGSRWGASLSFAVLAVLVVTGIVAVCREGMRGTELARRVAAAERFTAIRQGDNAEREWRAAVALAPDSADLWNRLGEHYASRHIWRDARAAYERLAALAPETPDLYMRLAACSRRAGDEIAALRYAKQALTRDPDDVTALQTVAELSVDAGDEETSLRCYERLAAIEPRNAMYSIFHAQSLIRLHRYAEAKAVLNPLLAREPDQAAARLLRGRVGVEAGESGGFAEAEEDLRRALALTTDNAAASFFLGRLYRLQQKRDAAVPLLRDAARLAPERSDVWYELAAACQAAGHKKEADEARARFQAVRQTAMRKDDLLARCQAKPDDFDAHRALGELALKTGDARHAAHFLTRARDLRPDDKPTQALLSAALADLSRRESAGGVAPP